LRKLRSQIHGNKIKIKKLKMIKNDERRVDPWRNKYLPVATINELNNKDIIHFD